MTTAIPLDCPECAYSERVARVIGKCTCECGCEYIRITPLECEDCPICYRACEGSRFEIVCGCGQRFRDPKTYRKPHDKKPDLQPVMIATSQQKTEPRYFRDLRVIVFELMRMSREMDHERRGGSGSVLQSVLVSLELGIVGLGHKTTAHASAMGTSLNVYRNRPPPDAFADIWTKYLALEGDALRAADLLIDDGQGLRNRELAVPGHRYDLTCTQWVGFWVTDAATRTAWEQRLAASRDYDPAMRGMSYTGEVAVRELIDQWVYLGDAV